MDSIVLIQKYFPDLTPEQCSQFEALEDMYHRLEQSNQRNFT